MRGIDTGALVLVVLLVLASRKKGKPMPPIPGYHSGINLVSKANTGGDRWAAERFAALEERGIVGDLARAIVAHWAFETSWGKGEWNYNVGNIIALPGQTGADIGPQINRAYDTLAHGVEDYLHLIETKYSECFALLNEQPLSSEWVRCLGRHGYYTALPDAYVKGYEADWRKLEAGV